MHNANATTQRTISALCERVASASVLLVACDYDGTLSRLVPYSGDATTHADSLRALGRLASQPHTHVAVISGRPRADLVQKFASIPAIHVVGSHGAEVDDSPLSDVSQDASLELAAVTAQLGHLADPFPGVRVESKPRGVALHYRDAPEEVVAKAKLSSKTRERAKILDVRKPTLLYSGTRAVSRCQLHRTLALG